MSDAQTLTRFRSSLVEWLSANLTEDVIEAQRAGADEDAHLEVLRAWNARLADAGWAAVSWPARFGGRDATVDEQLAYQEEMVRAGAPGPVNTIGVANIAPAIMALGTDEQKERFLRPMLRGDEIWCQGMSEPDAGSDLASLRTAARAEGDAFVVSGQKTWNSLGRFADWCQLYVRTDPDAPKHKGISCLLVDMTSPGHHRPALAHDVGRLHLLRALLRRGPRPPVEPARPAQRGLAGRHDHPQPRAGRGGPPAPGPDGSLREPAGGRAPTWPDTRHGAS